MKQCPKCGMNFNWLQRATGESRDHVRYCRETPKCDDKNSLAATCRGCPAGCFEGTFDKDDKRKKDD